MSSFNLFSDTLYCDAIHDNIMSIITNIRKAGNLKNETKNLIDEMEAKISDARSKGMILLLVYITLFTIKQYIN